MKGSFKIRKYLLRAKGRFGELEQASGTNCEMTNQLLMETAEKRRDALVGSSGDM